MTYRSAPRIPVAVVREQLQCLLERLFEGPIASRFDAIVEEYLDRYGAVPVELVPVEDVLSIASANALQRRVDSPCPAWCDCEPGHPFDLRSAELGTVVRIHQREFGEHVSVCSEEHAVSDEGPIWDLARPRVELSCENYHLTLDDARQTLVDLQAAVDFLESLS